MSQSVPALCLDSEGAAAALAAGPEAIAEKFAEGTRLSLADVRKDLRPDEEFIAANKAALLSACQHLHATKRWDYVVYCLRSRDEKPIREALAGKQRTDFVVMYLKNLLMGFISM